MTEPDSNLETFTRRRASLDFQPQTSLQDVFLGKTAIPSSSHLTLLKVSDADRLT